jgi:hypothetical protein
LEFWYPISDDSDGDTENINSLAPLISCRTLRAWLFLGKIWYRWSGRIWSLKVEEPFATVEDKDGNWAGILHLPELISPLASSDENNIAQKEQCELVMLSKGYYRLPVKNKKWPEEDDPGFPISFDSSLSAVYEFYNVLWIEWRQGIAYRKAMGRIKKDIWERDATEWIDLILG